MHFLKPFLPPSTTSTLCSIPDVLADWTIDRMPAEVALFNAIGKTAEKVDGLIPQLVSLAVDYLKVERGEGDMIFGEKEWTNHFGTVPPAPPLPADIEKIWQSPCPIFPEKRIRETHMLVYIPASLNGNPLTLKNLGIIAKKYYQGGGGEEEKEFKFCEVVKKIGDKPSGSACWVLMTRKSLPESMVYPEDQLKMVSALAKKTSAPYQIPTALDAVVCILARLAICKPELMMSIKDQHGYISCHGGKSNLLVALNAFDSCAFKIYYHTRCEGCLTVVAPLRKFSNEKPASKRGCVIC